MGKHVGFEMRQRVDLINPFFVPKCLLGTNFIETKASSLAVSISVLMETQDSGHLCQVAPLASGSLNLNSQKLDLETLVSTIPHLLNFCSPSVRVLLPSHRLGGKREPVWCGHWRFYWSVQEVLCSSRVWFGSGPHSSAGLVGAHCPFQSRSPESGFSMTQLLSHCPPRLA